MRKMTIRSQDSYIEINSEDIKNIIETFDGVSEVRNISDSTGKNIMGFNVILSNDYIEDLLKNQIEDIDYPLDEEGETILFEQSEYISDALIDNIREFLERRYNIDDFHGAYDIYKVSLEEGIGLTLTLSFGQVKNERCYKLASSINDRNIQS
ncbi:hypothetical protein [Paramaledivibacter caminithermalis]|jgi:hypothetical protein|uniref:Uncharacterized protein n=1 Tax=Paramaledivibacter caminithermalis (strain DSM 15212 / CIP 107654 / DViRD3) TaxID=1121301 RepID=A0A1M6R3L6_PARC5|nr:hypothetical protein [Paramaledivibacter caminithermalis]SHK27023.1 hypothetical protein SAMN02745912_02831 [Paramaledivibacter caminithermalis DSM 15212]